MGLDEIKFSRGENMAAHDSRAKVVATAVAIGASTLPGCEKFDLSPSGQELVSAPKLLTETGAIEILQPTADTVNGPNQWSKIEYDAMRFGMTREEYQRMLVSSIREQVERESISTADLHSAQKSASEFAAKGRFFTNGTYLPGNIFVVSSMEPAVVAEELEKLIMERGER